MGDFPRRLSDALDGLSRVFEAYTRKEGITFCGFCYDPAEIEKFKSLPLGKFDTEAVQRLVWETADHWHDTPTYKHFLPLILEALAPPRRCEDLYPEHLFETLNWHKFSAWPAAEREAVREYIEAVGASLEADEAEEWRKAAALLSG